MVASVPVSNTGGWQSWTSVTVPAGGATGVHRLYVVFRSASAADFVNVNWFQFSR
jgi:beta-glucosidase